MNKTFTVRFTAKTIIFAFILAVTISLGAYRESRYRHEIAQWTEAYDKLSAESDSLRLTAAKAELAGIR